MLIPLLLYLAMTLGVPILNGAPLDGEFLEHAAVVLVVAGAIGMVVNLKAGRR